MGDETRPSSPWPVLAMLLAFAVAVLAAFFLIAWQLDVASSHGPGVDRMITFLLIATAPIFLGGHLFIAWFAARPRKDARFWALSRRREWWSTLIPVLIIGAVAEGGVLVIGLPVWAEVYHPDPGAIQVEITAKQFEWISRLPGADGKFGRTDAALVNDAQNPIGLDEKDPAAADDIVERGCVYLPAGRTAMLRIRSLDVLHSFAVPVFRTKQDAVPGLVSKTQVRPTRPGKFEITCAELCGLGHYRMRGFVYVKTPEEFEKWLSEQTGWFE